MRVLISEGIKLDTPSHQYLIVAMVIGGAAGVALIYTFIGGWIITAVTVAWKCFVLAQRAACGS